MEPYTYYWFTREPDLLIQVESNFITHIFLVCDHVLRMASPVLDRMLDPKSRFKKLPVTYVNRFKVRILRLYDDDVPSWGRILNILHFQTQQTSFALDFEDLLAVAILCDKYDISSALHPWPTIWLDYLLVRQRMDIMEAGSEDFLIIAHAFRGQGLAHEVLKDMTDMLTRELVGNITIEAIRGPSKNEQGNSRYWRLRKTYSSNHYLSDSNVVKSDIDLELIPQGIMGD